MELSVKSSAWDRMGIALGERARVGAQILYSSLQG